MTWEFQDRTLTVKEWASELGITPAIIHQRLKSRLPLEAVLAPRLRVRNRAIAYQGESLTVKEWSRKLGIPEFTIYGRLKKNLPLDLVFSQEKLQRGNPRYLTFGGLTLTLHGWAERLGIPSDTLSGRVKRGWSVEKVLAIDRLTKDWSGHPSYKVLRRTGEKYHGSYLWEVEGPYCGRVFKAVPGKLGKAMQSCGCLRYHDYTGETVEFLYVVKMVGTRYYRSGNLRYVYECICTYKGCGKILLVDANQLATGK